MGTDVFAGVRLARTPVYGTKGMVVSGHSSHPRPASARWTRADRWLMR